MLDLAPQLRTANERVFHEYQDDIGKRREELITPALVLDIDAAQRNIDHMATALKQLGPATIRPHFKTHKSPELARRQVEAGAAGLSAATVWEAAVALARQVAGLPGLSFEGITGYEGHCSLTLDDALRRERQRVAMTFFTGVAERLEADGIPCRIRSAGGVATWQWTATHPGITEIQAGSYVVMDNYHGQMVPGFEHSLTVQASVISRQSDKVIVDAGNKSVADPANATIVGHPLLPFRFDEEHGIFAAPDGSPLRVGDSVALVPGYSPTTVNWYDAYHVVRGDVVIDVWPVIPRGPGHHGLSR